MNHDLRFVFFYNIVSRHRDWLRTASLQSVKIMPDNATVTEGGGVMVLKGGSMINAQRRAATETAIFIYIFRYNDQFFFT